MANKAEIYTILIEVYGYPENIAKNLCDYFDSAELEEFIEFLNDENK